MPYLSSRWAITARSACRLSILSKGTGRVATWAARKSDNKTVGVYSKWQVERLSVAHERRSDWGDNASEPRQKDDAEVNIRKRQTMCRNDRRIYDYKSKQMFSSRVRQAGLSVS
jgi:hypothetical protein